MVRVNDMPDSPLTPKEIKKWRKEQDLKEELRRLTALQQKAMKVWMADRNNKKKVDAFNKISFKIALTKQKLEEL